MENHPLNRFMPIIPFKLRLDIFILCESWCGFGLRFEHARQMEANSVKLKLDSAADQRARSKLSSQIDQNRKALGLVALKAMVTLLKGPITDNAEPGLTLDINSLLSWINAIISSSSSTYHDIVRPAIVSLLVYNSTNDRLFEDIICHCYTKDSKLPNQYFLAIIEFVSKNEVSSKYITKILCLALFQIGHESKNIRRGAANVKLKFL